MDSDRSNCRRRPSRRSVASLCAAAILSPSAHAFASFAPSSRSSNLALRSTVAQRYRVENESSDAAQPRSDVFSFLPSRLSSIECMDTPSQFKAQVLNEDQSLVVVRFFSEVCPSCKATRPLFRKWSRDIEANANIESNIEPLPIKIVEMPLNRATSSYLKDELHVDRLPYCHLYHPEFGLVEEEVVLNKGEFDQFVNVVDSWSKGGSEFNFDTDYGNEFDMEFGSEDSC